MALPADFCGITQTGVFWYCHEHFMDDSSNIRLEVVDFAFCPQGCGSYLGPLWIPKGRGNLVALSLSVMLVHSWVHWEPNSAPTCSDYGTFARRMGSHGGLFNKKDQRKDNGKEAMPCSDNGWFPWATHSHTNAIDKAHFTYQSMSATGNV